MEPPTAFDLMLFAAFMAAFCAPHYIRTRIDEWRHRK